MWKLIRYIDNHTFFPIFGSGKNLLQPIHAKDLGEAYFSVLINKRKTFGNQYNLSGYNQITYKDLLRQISSGLNKKTFFIHFPIWFSLIIVYIYNFLFKSSALISTEQVLRVKEDKNFSWQNAFNDFGYSPMSFEQGIKIELEEFLESQNK
jgi:dTDP-D-glucose 4,6-dehydratase